MKSPSFTTSARTMMVAATGMCILLTGCSYIAIASAPEKKPVSVRSGEAIAADLQFWDVFHGARYDDIPATLELLTGAYLKNPTDSVTASHVAWLHIWRLSERDRLDKVPATITDDAVLSRKYFQEAVTLNPEDARLLGFLAATTVGEGAIHKDEKLVRKGYYLLRDSIDAWPEFNLFTAGYTMSRQPVDSPQFREALDWQWKNVDLCAGEKISRTQPDYSRYMAMNTTVGPKRVCWNSQIAPHNFEGFFLNMGDMLVKSGDWQTAQKIYSIAKLSPDYGNWKYAPLLDEQIKNAQSNVTSFASNKGIMINTKHSCMACHQS